MDLRQIATAKEAVEKLKARRDRAVGVKEQLLRQLKELGASSEAEGRKLTRKLEREAVEAEAKADGLWKEFLEKYGHLLNGEEDERNR